MPSIVPAQPRADQVDSAALLAAAARLGRVIWAPVLELDRIGVDPFVLRPPDPDSCSRASASGCLPLYRTDVVVGGTGGADLWANLGERLIVQVRGRAVADAYRRYTDQSGVAPDISQAVRWVAPRFHVDFGWRHAEGRRGLLSEVAQRITRTAFDRRLTAVARLGRFAVETEAGVQRVRYVVPAVRHPLFRYDWFDRDISRARAVLRPAVPGPSRWSFVYERSVQSSLRRPVRQRRLDGHRAELETELLTGLRLEGRVAVGWQHLRRPDYHPALGRYSHRTSAPVWRIMLMLPSGVTDAELRLERTFSSSAINGPPSLDELRSAFRAGRRLTRRLRADGFVEHARLLYRDRYDPVEARTGRIEVLRLGAAARFAVTPRWSLGVMYLRNSWRDPSFANALPDRFGSATVMTLHYNDQGAPPSIAFSHPW